MTKRGGGTERRHDVDVGERLLIEPLSLSVAVAVARRPNQVQREKDVQRQSGAWPFAEYQPSPVTNPMSPPTTIMMAKIANAATRGCVDTNRSYRGDFRSTEHKGRTPQGWATLCRSTSSAVADVVSEIHVV